MDDVIYEEFKGTGNMELHLDRNSLSAGFSQPLKSTVQVHGVNLLLTAEELDATWVLRKAMSSLGPAEPRLAVGSGDPYQDEPGIDGTDYHFTFCGKC